MSAGTGVAVRVRVAGVWLDEISAAWQIDTVSWAYGLGDLTMQWSMQLGPRRPAPLTPGAVVEVMLGPIVVWRGRLTAPDYSDQSVGGTQTFSATGDSSYADTAPALASSGTTSTNPRVAAQTAITNGDIGWINVTALPNAAYSVPSVPSVDGTDATTDLNALGALLDAYATENSQTWGVHAGSAYMASDPTSHSWVVSTNANVIGYREPLASSLYARWKDTVGTLHTAHAGTGSPTALLDYVDFGALTAPRVASLLAGILRKTGPAYTWTGPLTLVPGQITTPGGQTPHPAALGAAIATGTMIRLANQRDITTGAGYVDVIAGQLDWSPTDQTLQLSPQATVDDDLDAIVEATGGTVQ